MSGPFPYDQVWALLPVLLLTLAGLVLLLLDVQLRGGARQFIVPLAGHAVAFTGVFAWWWRGHAVVRNALAVGTDPAGTIDMDCFVIGITMIACLGGLLCLYFSPQYLRRRGIHEGPYAVLWLLAMSGMVLMAQAADLLVLLIGLEIMSISFYILVGMDSGDARSPEAALKYFLNGTFASGVMIYGIALIYGATGTIALRALAPSVRELASSVSGPMPMLARAGLALLLAGFFFKVAAAPFHMWAPDVYEGAPTPITAFLATGVKTAAFAGMMRMLYLGFPGFAETWSGLLWGVAIATMVVGNIGALVQESLKRLLAYSSIAHAGYLLVALLSVSPADGDWIGGQALVFYLLVYTVGTVGAFALLASTGRESESLEQIVDYRGLGRTHPWHALMMTLFMLALAGLPPTAGFLGKYFIFAAAVKRGYTDLAVIGVLTSLMSAYYYLKIIVNMYFHEPDPEAPFVYTPDVITSAAVWVSAAAVLWLGVWPAHALKLAGVAMSSLF